jgi:NADPH:quinone reductase-like Zn-dependent oxidoreductase
MVSISTTVDGVFHSAMMRALLVDQFGGAELMRVGELGIPEPAEDEVLVRVMAAGIGPWDVEFRRGGWQGPLPYVPGAQFAGLVIGDTGGDAGFEDGAPVYGWPGPGGCHAQYVTCQVERLAAIPAGLRMTEAAAVPVDALTADQGIAEVLAVGAADRVLITDAAGGLGHFAVQLARALGATVVATASPRDHQLVHRLGAAVVVDETAAHWPDEVRTVTDGGAEKVLACTGSSLPGAARAARDGAPAATPVQAGTRVPAELPEPHRIDWQRYTARPSGSRLIRMAPRFDDGTLTVRVPAMFYWQDAAQAHRVVEQGGAPGEVVLIVDDDLAAALEV